MARGIQHGIPTGDKAVVLGSHVSNPKRGAPHCTLALVVIVAFNLVKELRSELAQNEVTSRDLVF